MKSPATSIATGKVEEKAPSPLRAGEWEQHQALVDSSPLLGHGHYGYPAHAASGL